MCAVTRKVYSRIAEAIERATGISKDSVFLAATHTHTNAFIEKATAFEADEGIINEYADFLVSRVTDTAKLALDDLKPAKVGFGVGYAPDKTSYIRRYKMKDGTTMTCPPIDDPNIDYPIGELDRRVNVVRFDREGDFHTLPFYGTIDWESVTKAFAEVGYEGNFSYEAGLFVSRVPMEFLQESARYMAKVAKYLVERVEYYKANN